MKISAIFILALCWSVISVAALPEGVEPAQWEALIQRIVAEGKASDTGAGTYLSLERIVPADKSVSHQADYISAVGAFTADGRFSASHLESVYETWTKLEDGNWAIDQWLFPVSLLGNLKRCHHVRILETPDGSVLEHTLTPLTEEEAEREWAPRLRSWL
jgi:hypothetical protein